MRNTIELLFKMCTTFVLLGLILILIGALPAALVPFRVQQAERQ